MKWKLVPVEPTGDMCHSVYQRTVQGIFPSSEYRSMLAASPDPTQDEALVVAMADTIQNTIAIGYRDEYVKIARAVLVVLKGGV